MSFTSNVSVDIGDINDNGTPEIFVTAYTTTMDTLASYVIEFDGKAFKTIMAKAKFYFRVIDHPHRGLILLGQKQRSGDKPHRAPILELAWKGGEYIRVGTLLKSNKVNLLGFALGDIIGDRTEQAVGLNEANRLRMMQLNGKEMWTSADRYGGTPLYYALPGETPGDEFRSAFLPVRVLVADLDQDGKLEVIVPQNIDTAGQRLTEHRFFKKSKILSMVWDGLGLTPGWGTRSLSGRIQDLAIADFDNDGQKELVAAVVSQDPNTIKKAKSALIAFDLKKQESE